MPKKPRSAIWWWPQEFVHPEILIDSGTSADEDSPLWNNCSSALARPLGCVIADRQLSAPGHRVISAIRSAPASANPKRFSSSYTLGIASESTERKSMFCVLVSLILLAYSRAKLATPRSCVELMSPSGTRTRMPHRFACFCLTTFVVRQRLSCAESDERTSSKRLVLGLSTVAVVKSAVNP